LISRMEENLTDNELEMSDEDINALCAQKADKEFKKLCVDPLERVDHALPYANISVDPPYRGTLTNLIDLTQRRVEEHVEGDVWIVSAMAQRASAEAKIISSIEVGMKQYWQGLASSASFSGSTLEQCLATIHIDITSCWNFNDPDNLLNGDDFQKKIKILAQLVTPDVSQLPSWFDNLNNIHNIIGVASVLAAAAAPAVAAIGLSAMFINWVTGVYRKTPEALRCLMGYIVDLTLVMDQLFLDTLPVEPPRRVTVEHIDMALENYKASEAAKVHHDIREYANQATFAKILQSNKAQDKVIQLIQQHRAGGVA